MKKEEFFNEASAYLTKKGAKIVTVEKNNGQKLTGASLEFLSKDAGALGKMCPTIYLEQLFEGYDEDVYSIEAYLEDVVKKAEATPFPTFDLNPENMKGRMFPVLVNKDTNKELLEKIPHRDYVGDIAIIYRVMWQGEEEMGSSMVNYGLAKKLGMSEDDLYRTSMANLLLEGTKVLTMEEMICEITGMEVDDSISPMMEETPMYVITNQARTNGSGAILNPVGLEKIAEKIGTNLFLFPSSIHEWIIVGENDDLDYFRSMVCDINENEIAPTDFLSNNIYYYDRATKQISVAA